MSDRAFREFDEPSGESIRLLKLSLRVDCENKGVSSENYAHRARVIRQQTELLGRRKASPNFAMLADEAASIAAHAVMDNEGAYIRSTDDTC